MSDIYYKQEDCFPFIYVEEAINMTPQSIINHVRDNDFDYLYTGFNNGKLRTAFHMGTIDITNYELFTSAEIPFMSQAIFDTLYYEIEDINNKISEGYTLDQMDEIFLDKAYSLYIIHDKDYNPIEYYAINIENNKTTVLKTIDIFNIPFEIILEK